MSQDTPSREEMERFLREQLAGCETPEDVTTCLAELKAGDDETLRRLAGFAENLQGYKDAAASGDTSMEELLRDPSMAAAAAFVTNHGDIHPPGPAGDGEEPRVGA